MRIRLVAARWRPPGAEAPMVAGDVADVDEVDADRLIRAGLAVPADAATAVEAPAPEPEPEREPPAEAPVEDAPVSEAEVTKPKRVARLEEWQAYARAMGVGTNGKSKAQLIAELG